MRSPLDRAPRWLTFGTVVGGVAAIAWALVRMFCSWLHVSRVASPVIAAVLCLAAKPLLARLERWATGASHGTATSVMTAGLAPVYAWAAGEALAAPIIDLSGEPEDIGLGTAIGVGAAMLLLGVTFGAIGALSRGRLGRMRDSMLTPFAIGALGIGACLTSWASLRLVTHPDLDAYLGAAREAVVVFRAEEPLTPWSVLHRGPRRYRIFIPRADEPLTPEDSAGLISGLPAAPIIIPAVVTDGSQAYRAPYVDEIILDEQTVLRRECQEGACAVDLHPRVDAPGAPSLDRTAEGFSTDARLYVYTLPAEQLWLVESGDRRAAFHEATLERVDVSVLNLARSIAAPPLLVFASVLGIALAWLTLAQRGSLIERLVALDSAREAFLDERGWLAFADGAPPARAVAPPPLPGPVLLLAPRTASAGTYRSASDLEERAPLLPGTRADARAEIDTAIAGRFATALAAVAVLSAPIAVFALTTFGG